MQSTARWAMTRQLVARLHPQPAVSLRCLCSANSQAAAAAAVVEEDAPDWVRSSVQKILEQASSNNSNSNLVVDRVKPRDVEQSLLTLHNQLQEAELCVRDCQEVNNKAELVQEVADASVAVDETVAYLVDWLEENRAAQKKADSEAILQRIKNLRADLAVLESKDIKC